MGFAFFLLQEKDIKTFNTITKSFLEVKKMDIPLIQYCIMKNAIDCFKYLLVNGYDDPNKTMQDLNPDSCIDSYSKLIKIKRYEWDCMATAIYFGNKEIIGILEDKGIGKGKKFLNHTREFMVIKIYLNSYWNLTCFKEVIVPNNALELIPRKDYFCATYKISILRIAYENLKNIQYNMLILHHNHLWHIFQRSKFSL